MFVGTGRMPRAQKLVIVAAAALVVVTVAYVMLAVTAAPVEFDDPALAAAVHDALARERRGAPGADYRRITRLDAENRGIESLAGIEQLTNLEVLNVRGNPIHDVSPIAALPRLRELNLRDTNTPDLAAARLDELAALPELRELNLRHNRGPSHPESPDDHARIRDIAVLAGFTRLEYLDLSDNHIDDIAPLASLTRLARLDLRDNRLESDNLRALGALTELEYLNLRGNRVRRLDGIETLRNLVYLNLRGNREISSIEPIAELRRLGTLIVRDLEINDQLDVLETLPNLSHLNVRNAGITDLTPIARMMERGVLQDDPARGIYAEVDIRENPISVSGQTDGYAVLEPYWSNVSRRHPQELPAPMSREVVISEVMSSNGATIDDGTGEFPDWIELFNPGDVAVDLSGYYLSDHRDRSTRWEFPDGATIEAGEHLLVWASGRDAVGADGRYHTSFRLDGHGEAAIITRPDGRTRVDALLFPRVPRDMSYGRRNETDDFTTERAVYTTFAMPTPGSANVEGYEFQPVEFSHASGFHSGGFGLRLSTPTLNDPPSSEHRPGARPRVAIYYTLDGSVPDPGTVGNPRAYTVRMYEHGATEEATGPRFETRFERTYRYDRPIVITDFRSGSYTVASALSGEPRIVDIPTTSPNAEFWEWKPPVTDTVRGTVVRAAVFTEEDQPVRISEISTATYFAVLHGPERFSLPVVTIATPPSALFDYDDGAYVPGRVYDDLPPYEESWMAQDANYRRPWEPAVHLEFFETDGVSAFAIDGGIRVHGAYSRSHPLKSLRLYARKLYGVTDSFEHPIFPDATRRDDPTTPIDRYRRLILRSGQSLFRSHMQDAVIQHQMNGRLEIELLRYRPVVHFVNGEYWGIKNLRERFDRFYIEANYGIDPDDVIIVEGPFGFDRQLVEGEPRDNRPYNALHTFIAGTDMRDPEAYARVLREMDVVSFIDYNIARIYSGDRDGVNDHVAVWRKRTAPDPSAGTGHDGRWRWHTWDFDNAFMGQNNTMEFYANDGLDDAERAAATGIHSAFHRSPEFTAMIVSLFRNDEFRTTFLNRFAGFLNTVFHPDEMNAAIDAAAALLEPEMPEHIERWGYPASIEYWRDQIASHKRFVAARPAVQRRQIIEYFTRRGWDLPGTFELTVENEHPDGGFVRVENVDVRTETPGIADARRWTGVWFSRVPVRITAVPARGYRFAGWTGDLDAADTAARTVLVTADSSTRIAARFDRVE